MGRTNTLKSKEELLDEKFAEIVKLYNLDTKFIDNPDLYRKARSLFDAYISSASVQDAIDKGFYQDLETTSEFSAEEFYALRQSGIDQPIINYVRDYINIEKLRG
jgi:hypothetical protein